MIDPKLNQPDLAEVELDAETLARIDHGLKAAEQGRSIPLEDARKMIPKWITKFESQNPR